MACQSRCTRGARGAPEASARVATLSQPGAPAYITRPERNESGNAEDHGGEQGRRALRCRAPMACLVPVENGVAGMHVQKSAVRWKRFVAHLVVAVLLCSGL